MSEDGEAAVALLENLRLLFLHVLIGGLVGHGCTTATKMTEGENCRLGFVSKRRFCHHLDFLSLVGLVFHGEVIVDWQAESLALRLFHERAVRVVDDLDHLPAMQVANRLCGVLIIPRLARGLFK